MKILKMLEQAANLENSLWDPNWQVERFHIGR